MRSAGCAASLVDRSVTRAHLVGRDRKMMGKREKDFTYTATGRPLDFSLFFYTCPSDIVVVSRAGIDLAMSDCTHRLQCPSIRADWACRDSTASSRGMSHGLSRAITSISQTKRAQGDLLCRQLLCRFRRLTWRHSAERRAPTPLILLSGDAEGARPPRRRRYLGKHPAMDPRFEGGESVALLIINKRDVFHCQRSNTSQAFGGVGLTSSPHSLFSVSHFHTRQVQATKSQRLRESPPGSRD
jgi:hypothetical protein